MRTKNVFFLAITILLLAFEKSPEKKASQAILTGEIKGCKDSVVYLFRSLADMVFTDTIPVNDGKFTWTGVLEEPQQAKLYLNGKGAFEFFMENAAINLVGHVDSLRKISVTGAASTDEFYRLNKMLDRMHDENVIAVDNYRTAPDSVKARFDKEYAAFLEKRYEAVRSHITSHPGSYVSLYWINRLTRSREYPELNAMFQQMNPGLRDSRSGKKIAEKLIVLKKTAPGGPAPAFTLPDLAGKFTSLADYKGRYVLLDFWASWCGPCRAENPNVIKAYNQFRSRNFTVVTISIDDSESAWRATVKKDGMIWDNLRDPKGRKAQVVEDYGIQMIPYTLLLDPNGVIIAKNLRGKALHAKLEAVLP